MIQTGIQIQVTGNTAKVTQKPDRITSGTIGLPVAFVFDNQWDDLEKIAVFQAGETSRAIVNPGEGAVVPWEVLSQPGVWLYAGVYGISKDGSVAIPTVWVHICPIQPGVNPENALAEPTPALWQEMMRYFDRLEEKVKMRIGTITLLSLKWTGSSGLYWQTVQLAGITAFSQVDLKPSPAQMARFQEMDIAFTTVNEDGVLTVYAIGDRPVEDYTMDVSITEVRV